MEGHRLLAVEVGHTDTDDTTVLHVPSIGLVVAGDVATTACISTCSKAPGNTCRCARNANCCRPPHPIRRPGAAVVALDVDANELVLVYRARGMRETEAAKRADEVLSRQPSSMTGQFGLGAIDSASTKRSAPACGPGVSSFCFFASGALAPVLPYLVGLQGVAALVVAAVLVGIALAGTGVIVGLLLGGPPYGARCANCSSDMAPPPSPTCWAPGFG